MNTLSYDAPILQQTRSRDYVILLEDLEFGMSREQLKHITNLHNEGMHFQEISQEVKRNPFEVIVALLHQAKTNNVKLRPFAYTGDIKESTLLVPGKEQLKNGRSNTSNSKKHRTSGKPVKRVKRNS